MTEIMIQLSDAIVTLEVPGASHWTVATIVNKLETDGLSVRRIGDFVVVDGRSSTWKEPNQST